MENKKATKKYYFSVEGETAYKHHYAETGLRV